MAPSPEPLPPFSGDHPTCPKCSAGQAFTEYKTERDPRTGNAINGLGQERLERRCARCDFIWDEAVNPPAKGTA